MKTCREDKPYIFISYAHKDAVRVIDIINGLVKNGYNVWYDEGIDPGTEWDENIAAHIKNCSYFIAFISANYINSKNCKDELNFSRNLEKDQLLLYLEDVSLPDGLEMRMNRIQAIFWNRYDNAEISFEKLFAAKGIEVTKLSEDAPEGFTEFTVPKNLKAISSQDTVANAVPKKKTKKGLGKAGKIVIAVAALIAIAAGSVFGVKTASSKHLDEMILTGIDYIKGESGKEYSPETALTYFEKASAKGSEDASFLAGYTCSRLIYEDRESSVEKATSYLEKCGNNPYALIELGNIYAYDLCALGQDIDLAESYYTKAFALTNADTLKEQTDLVYYAQACNVLGIEYYNGYYTQKDYAIAKELFKIGSHAMLPESMHNLGMLYSNDDNEEKDWNEIKRLYQYGANLGYSPSLHSLGAIYIGEDGSPYEDYEKAVELFNKVAALGDSNGYNGLGYMYGLGYVSGSPDYEKAIEYYEKGADCGNASSMRNIALMYENGQGVDADSEKAIEWFEKSYSNGLWKAALDIGNIYCEGNGNVEQDFEKAIEWYKKAADKKQTAAYNNIGKMYSYDKYNMVDYDEALKWFEKAAEAEDAEGYQNLALYYQKSRVGFKADYPKSIELLEKALELGSANAAWILGFNYFYGVNIDSKQTEQGIIEIDEQKGIEYFIKGSDMGSSWSSEALGLIYCGDDDWRGETIEIDYKKSRDYLKKAIDQGENDPKIYYKLANIYVNKLGGITTDDVTIYELYKTAADLGYAKAMTALGTLYTTKMNDADIAYEWFKKGYEAGDPDGNAGIACLYYYKYLPSKDALADTIQYAYDAYENGSIEAPFLLGKAYKDLGSYNDAYTWFYKECELGQKQDYDLAAEGATEIGKLIEEGKTEGIEFPEGYTTAEAWYKLADSYK